MAAEEGCQEDGPYPSPWAVLQLSKSSSRLFGWILECASRGIVVYGRVGRTVEAVALEPVGNVPLALDLEPLAFRRGSFAPDLACSPFGANDSPREADDPPRIWRHPPFGADRSSRIWSVLLS